MFGTSSDGLARSLDPEARTFEMHWNIGSNSFLRNSTPSAFKTAHHPFFHILKSLVWCKGLKWLLFTDSKFVSTKHPYDSVKWCVCLFRIFVILVSFWSEYIYQYTYFPSCLSNTSIKSKIKFAKIIQAILILLWSWIDCYKVPQCDTKNVKLEGQLYEKFLYQ